MADQRNELRFPVHWRVAIFPEGAGKPFHFGETYELSPAGAGIYCDYGQPENTTFLLHLEIPAMTKDGHGVDLEISARVVHLSLNSQHGFRIGVLFKQFKDNGKALLVQALTQRFQPK
ncbi:MAG: hypothetical protein KGZ83_21615 [Sulfuricella sp.]|nr:hypothetical protein [Sulfuricella sp.]